MTCRFYNGNFLQIYRIDPDGMTVAGHGQAPRETCARATVRKEPAMADNMKDRDNKDAQESGRPVQLDPEKGGKGDEQQGGQEHQGDKQGMEPGQKPGQPGQQPQHQNR
jgi:hypothetical protein